MLLSHTRRSLVRVYGRDGDCKRKRVRNAWECNGENEGCQEFGEKKYPHSIFNLSHTHT